MDCPFQYKCDYIDGLDDGGPGPSAERGTRLHKNAEDYIKSTELVVLEKDMVPLGPELERMKQNGWLSEEVWLAGRDWLPVVADEDAWIKSIIDLHHVDQDILEIVDLKSGKRYPDHADQLQIYALLGLKRFPGIRRVDVAAWYVDEKGAWGHRESYMPQMFDYYAERWNTLAARMFADTTFTPTPSKNACKWCHFKKSKGGPCEEGDRW